MNRKFFGKIRAEAIVINLLLLIISFTCIFPFIWLLYSSFKTNSEFLSDLFALPTHLEWNNYYSALIRSHILKYFINTVFNALSSVAVIVFFTFCIGYYIARYDFKGKKLAESLLMLGMVVPVHALLVPMYMQFKIFNMVDHRGVLIFPYMGVMIPLTVFLIEAYVKAIPIDMEQSAGIEGASLVNTILKIIIPMCKPIIITVIILAFNYSWNELPFSLILNPSEKVRNMAVGIMNFSSQFNVNWAQRIAACVIALLPVTFFYMLFNEQIIQGMTEGAVKG